MTRYLYFTIPALLVVLFAKPTLAQTNVALGKPVTQVSGGSLLSPETSLNVITDGTFLAEITAYGSTAAEQGAIRWNTGVGGNSVFEIQLGGLYVIDGIMVQADDNDSLLVSYLDQFNTFQPLYNVGNVSVGFGFRTRPNVDQTTWATLSPIETTTIQVTNVGGDGFYGISELQLRGSAAVPEPSSLIILVALSSIEMLRRRRS